MKFTIETPLSKSPEEIWRIFDDPASLKKWQPSLRSFELISGEAGQPGAVSRLVYDENGREIILTETIISRDEPHEFTGIYAGSGISNRVSNRFVAQKNGGTLWIMENEFNFSGAMRLMGRALNGMLKKRTEGDVARFKALAEN